MRIVAASNAYWHTQEDFNVRYEGVAPWSVDAVTDNFQPALNPIYGGRFGLRQWRENMMRYFSPVEMILACGTWSDPAFSVRDMPDVRVVNAGVPADRPHSSHWQYMGCAMTALMAYLCNRRDWNVLMLISYEYLLGGVDWDAVLREFMSRPEEVFGPRWYERHGDFIGYKPAAAVRFLHQRIRPNLSEDETLPWLDDELCQMFKGRAWNPFPDVRTVRQDFFHLPSQWEGCPDNAEVMTWPMIRMPDPAIIDRYLAEQTSQAKPVLAHGQTKA